MSDFYETSIFCLFGGKKMANNSLIYCEMSYEYQSYIIAKTKLGTSFSLMKSNGFIKWKKQYQALREIRNLKTNWTL